MCFSNFELRLSFHKFLILIYFWESGLRNFLRNIWDISDIKIELGFSKYRNLTIFYFNSDTRLKNSIILRKISMEI